MLALHGKKGYFSKQLDGAERRFEAGTLVTKGDKSLRPTEQTGSVGG